MFTLKLRSSLYLLLTLSKDFVNADCGIVSKKDWDGLEPIHVQYLPRPVDLVIIQHTVTPTCSNDADCENIVRSIQTNHMDQQHFWDIGPSFLVGGNGKVYEGSGWLRVGAHTYGFNSKSIGISFIGNFNVDEPTPRALEAVQSLIKCGVDRGHLKSSYRLIGHRQVIGTESPGRKLYAKIRRWPNWLEDASPLKPKTA